MTALDKFKKTYSELPTEARKELVINAYGKRPATLNIIWLEASSKTSQGKKWLKQLGYKK